MDDIEKVRGMYEALSLPPSRTRSPRRILKDDKLYDAKVPTGLYFIQSQCAERRIKIGIPNNIKERLGKLKKICPYELKILRFIPGAAHLEKPLHARLAHLNIHGEWFRNDEMIIEIMNAIEEPVTPSV